MYDVRKIRADFPILAREVNGKPLVYLDNGASAQKPQVVIDAVTRGYAQEYANVHRGLHFLSNLATEKYEATRGILARFLNAGSEEEIVFTTGTTEAINLVSYAWAAPRLGRATRSCCRSWSITPTSSLGISCANGRAWC
jgi:cysteine desulfurase / selenocysteine lyase